MRKRRRTVIAGIGLLAAGLWLERAPLVTIEADLTDRPPATARAAVNLGVLGTVMLSWTVKQFN